MGELDDFPSKELLIWIDLEMTGLDPIENKIIEIATIVTDRELNIIAEGPNIAIHQTESELEKMDDWNVKHHTASGLVEKVRESKYDNNSAELDTLNFLKKYCVEFTAPLCGNTITQDRRFIERYMPDLYEFLHYRNIDVSSFKEVAKCWYPKLSNYIKSGEHTALKDIQESIEELKYYRKTMLK